VGKKDRGKRKSKSGQTLSGLRGGFKSAVGAGRSKRKESLASKIITWTLLAAAVGVLIYRLTR
jgi:hypothetical protein